MSSRRAYHMQGSNMLTTAQIETQQLRIHLLEVQNRIQMLQQYRQHQRQAPAVENIYQSLRLDVPHHSGSSQYQHLQKEPPQRTFLPPNNYGTLPTRAARDSTPSSRVVGRHWPQDENTYCDLDSTDSSLCWSSYLPKSMTQPSAATDSNIGLSGITDLSIDELHTLEHSLEHSLAEISSILPDEGQEKHGTSYRDIEISSKLLPRNSTPNLRGLLPPSLSVHRSTNTLRSNDQSSQKDYHYAPPVRRSTISHPSSVSYHHRQRRVMSVPQPISSGEYSEYIQRLAFEDDTTNDSSILDSTFASYQRHNLIDRNVPPRTQSMSRQRPACIGQDSVSTVTVHDLSTFTHVNDSNASELQLEDPGSDSAESDYDYGVPSGDSNPDMTMDSDATCFMKNPLCSRPVTYKQKEGRYKTMTNRLRKVGQQIKNKSSKNFKTLAVL